ncbi:cysteine dioxygenase family protein [Roseinatronobacter sp. S2]|uniref:cysteine dioxygenase family protein n=1 Tax=Roseinatronobacter sp. S2 TaxID=3035471 RepID=UPI00240F0350|nr:cysteine dioxygenase family protein [Roseinatronobacter sp. S2]WFE76682.1 cysteine dioxygenase family protein [Roseinatronobacter sp. S2]
MNKTFLHEDISSPAVAAGDTRFINFARACTLAVDHDDTQARVADLTHAFVADWRMPDSRFLQLQKDAPYASYLLYLSEAADLCIVLDVFMTQQAAIAHNHLCWCVFSCLEGVEREYLYKVPDDLSAAPVEILSRLRKPGEVTMADAAPGAFHQVECAQGDMAVSLHIYGADIGRLQRHMWNRTDAEYVQFRSDYSNSVVGLPAYLSTKDVAKDARQA